MFSHSIVLCAMIGLSAPATLDEKERDQFHHFPTRMHFLVEQLKARLPLDKAIESPLKEIIDYLEDVSSPPESALNPSLRVRFVVDEEAFRQKNGVKYKVLDECFHLPKMTGASLESALRILFDQFDGILVVRADHLLITTFEKHFGRERRKGESPILIYYAAVKVPLKQLTGLLSFRSGRTIALSDKVGEKADAKITVQLLNITSDTAIEALSEMTSLKAVRREGAVLLTTPEHAKELLDSKVAESLPGKWERLPTEKGKGEVPK